MEDGLFVSTPKPALLLGRDMAWALSCRAMRSAGEGKLAAAVDDLCALRRISRLMAQDQFLISRLVALSLDAIAVDSRGDDGRGSFWTADDESILEISLLGEVLQEIRNPAIDFVFPHPGESRLPSRGALRVGEERLIVRAPRLILVSSIGVRPTPGGGSGMLGR